ncbi:MAG: hypothetical protein ACHQX3_01750, partial [Nitrospirales bacterium]
QGLRWLSFSSNSYKDLEDELFTTEALEEAVAWADEHDSRGPLRIFHVPGADIGDADFQAVSDRFLIESGSFRDDELGQKAVAYFKEHGDDEFQVSIGFSYKMGDEKDGIYDWLRINERSVTPFGDAANPFTSFAFGEIGGEQMDERKMKMLNEMFGAELASKIVGKAADKSRELEENGHAFKSVDLSADLKTLAEKQDVTPQDLADLYEKYKKPAMKEADDKEEEEAANKKEATVDFTGVVAALEAVVSRLDDLDTMKQSVTALEEEVKTLKETKETASAAPKGAPGFRASENGLGLDAERIKELTGGSEQQPVNPARAYIEDLFQHGATVN